MSLHEIYKKEPTVATPSVYNLVAAPEMWDRKFHFHVSTHVSIGNLGNRWDAIINNLLKKRSVTGLIYADKGYGKTSTGISLWQAAEAKQIVTVPPFVWGSLADMLTATHAWVCYRLQDTRPEFIPDIEQKHREIVEVDEETLAQRLVQENGLSYDQARNTINHLRETGRLLEVLSPHQLLDYLRFTTQILLKSGYNGLLMLPDEFELFKTNPDISQNYQNLKEFIFGLYEEENSPVGCVAFTYNRTFADIELRASHILDRFNKPEGSQINLEQLYGQTDFAKYLWEKLSGTLQLSPSEQNAVDTDVLEALGQFLRHPRSRELMSGPRSVVRTFNRAAQRYIESSRPYSIFDFCDDYLSGNISYGSQESETASAYNQIIGLPIVGNTTDGDKIVKLLCVHPEGIPSECFQKYGIPEQAKDAVIQELLGDHVNIKVTGPALKIYRDDLLGVDELNEILKMLRGTFSPADKEFHRAAVRAFRKHVLSEILTKKAGTSLGWVITEIDGDFGFHCRLDAKGTVLSDYPDRTLTIDVATEILSNFPTSDSQFRTQFTLDTTNQADNACYITANSLDFRFNVRQPIDAQRVPEDIGKLGELFLPEFITPLLLLSILDFFDSNSIVSMVESAKQEAEVGFLKERIRNELIRYFFPPEIKTEAHFDPVELSTNFQSVTAGKDFVENVLRILIPKQFPDYSAVATAAQWRRYLDAYKLALSNIPTLAIRRGIEPMAMANSDVPGHFGLSSISAFRNFNNVVGRELLRFEDSTERQVEVTSKQEQVNVFFTLHRFEKRLIEQLETSSTNITVDGEFVNAITLPFVHKHAAELGYAKDEVNELVDILKARGIIKTKNEIGMEHLYIADISINFSELKAKLSNMEKVIKLAESKGFDYQYESFTSARNLIQTEGVENDEAKKDELRQKLDSTENNLQQYCRNRIITEQNRLEQQINDFERLRLPVPKVLEQQTDYPPVDFCQILFDDIQNQVKRAYVSLSNEITTIQSKVRDTVDREVEIYQSGQTLVKTIEAADRLKSERTKVDRQIKSLSHRQDGTQELFQLFDPWRHLARQCHNDKRSMENSREDMEVSNLIDRLNVVVSEIRFHLSEQRENLKDILSNSEHFKLQIDSIKSEFETYQKGKESDFIKYQANFENLLRKLLEKPHIGVSWNPADQDGCYRDTRQKVVGKLKEIIGEARHQIDSLKRDLRQPINILAVPDELKDKSVALSQDLQTCDQKFLAVRSELAIEQVDTELGSWVSTLISLRDDGVTYLKRWEEIREEMQRFRSALSQTAQRLHDAVNPLIEDGTFPSAREIVECLEELYELRSNV
ncbi:MAG: hypothetical protein OXG97_16275 [Candidatus Poribacteria bacterium]|nr:hypothetical protein [Candidatus Poribacteria bacterium]